MRVTEPLRAVDIVISADGKKLLSFSKPYVKPGEMIDLPLPEKIIEKLEGNSVIQIDILEKGEK